MKRAVFNVRAKFGVVYFLLYNPLSSITSSEEEMFSLLSSFPSVGHVCWGWRGTGDGVQTVS